METTALVQPAAPASITPSPGRNTQSQNAQGNSHATSQSLYQCAYCLRRYSRPEHLQVSFNPRPFSPFFSKKKKKKNNHGQEGRTYTDSSRPPTDWLRFTHTEAYSHSHPRKALCLRYLRESFWARRFAEKASTKPPGRSHGG